MKKFYNYEMPPPKPSMWVNYPTKNGTNEEYKYGGIEINKSYDRKEYSRSTYSLLDYLGDLGGLFGALESFFVVLITPFSSL